MCEGKKTEFEKEREIDRKSDRERERERARERERLGGVVWPMVPKFCIRQCKD